MSAAGPVHVVLLKALSDSENEDRYSGEFRAAGYEVTLVQTLDFRFDDEALSSLYSKLRSPEAHSGIIFTSPRSVSALELLLSRENDVTILDPWKQKKNFAVGEATAKMVEDLGLSAEGKEAGNSNELVKIISKDRYDNPFLHPTTSLAKARLEVQLKEHNIDVEEIQVYHSIPHPSIRASLDDLKSCSTGKMLVFVYFSPSGVDFTFPTLREFNFDLNQIKFVAIGPTTEAALIQKGVRVSATSKKPEASALLDAVSSLGLCT